MAKRKLNKLFIVYQMVPHIVYAESPDEARDIAASNMQLNINEFAKNLTQQVTSILDIPDSIKNNVPMGLNTNSTLQPEEKTLQAHEVLNLIQNNSPKLKFEYCECGCKGFSVKVGSREFSIYIYCFNEKN